jgi:hypothetical protein
VVDVNEPTVVVLPTEVGPTNTQLRCECWIAGEQFTCIVFTGKSLSRGQHRRGLPVMLVLLRIT